MIELKKHKVRIAHLNVRSELHGEDEVTAVDIKLTFDVPNTALDTLRDGLRASLYEQGKDPDMADEAGDHLTALLYPQLGTLKWKSHVAEAVFRIHCGNGRGKGDLAFGDVKFDKLTVTPKEGGTCSCTAQAQVLPTPEETAKLVGLLKREVPVTTDMSEAVNVDEDGVDEDGGDE